MTGSRHSSRTAGSVDWWAIAIYLLLVLIGWANIYAAVYDEAHASIFDTSQRYGMQLVWIGVAAVTAVIIMLIDTRLYHMFAYPAYCIGILILMAVLFFGREVNGAKAWIYIGSTGIQPTEFVKFTTSLAVARFMSKDNFAINKASDIFKLPLLVILPVLVIMLQNDTGSAIVYGAFFFVFYREGLNGWIYIILIMLILLFIFSFLITPITILILLVLGCVAGEGMVNGYWREKVIYLSAVAMCSILLYCLFNYVLLVEFSAYLSLLISVCISVVFAVAYAYRRKLHNVFIFIALFFSSLAFTAAVDYVFDNMLQVHQQKRVLDLLGIESDTQKWGYNVNQSKIAIGSGGFSGKGFLEGTQTRYDFVPEQSTDFIFCTVGEEWGFAGSSIVVLLFMFFILRIMKIAELQRAPFGRIYCYSVAAIFFVHVVINIGMTIGIMPVIGIPLPFFSYGGSSFLAFTVLFFVAVKLDADRRELMRH